MMFLRLLHLRLALLTAEQLRRRQTLIAAAEEGLPHASPAPPLLHPCPLPPERQLTVSDLRQLEVQRRQTLGSASLPATPPPAAAAPVSGEPRRRWLRERLIQLIGTDTVACPAASGSVAACLLELFERVTDEPFSDTPGALLTQRVRAIAKVLGNLVREVTFEPPLTQGRRRSSVTWNRCPRVRADWEAWRRGVEAAEEYRAPALRSRSQKATVDATLADWACYHPHLQPTSLDNGESGMALLILWEVDHGRPFPTQGDGTDRAAVLVVFSRRLQARAAAHDELSQYLQYCDKQQPLAPGLGDTHHRRWSVRIRPPRRNEPQGWYTEFTARWRAYLATHLPAARQPQPRPTTHAGPDDSTSSSNVSFVLPTLPPPGMDTHVGGTPASPAPAAPVRPQTAGSTANRPQRPRMGTRPSAKRPAAAPAAVGTPTAHSTPTGTARARPRAASATPPPPARRRQTDLRSWAQQRPAPPPDQEAMPPQEVPPPVTPPHGRAAAGPPT